MKPSSLNRMALFFYSIFIPFENLTTSAKIRLMLALLFASLLFTATIVQKTYTPKNTTKCRRLMTNPSQKV